MLMQETELLVQNEVGASVKQMDSEYSKEASELHHRAFVHVPTNKIGAERDHHCEAGVSEGSRIRAHTEQPDDNGTVTSAGRVHDQDAARNGRQKTEGEGQRCVCLIAKDVISAEIKIKTDCIMKGRISHWK